MSEGIFKFLYLIFSAVFLIGICYMLVHIIRKFIAWILGYEYWKH